MYKSICTHTVLKVCFWLFLIVGGEEGGEVVGGGGEEEGEGGDAEGGAGDTEGGAAATGGAGGSTAARRTA